MLQILNSKRSLLELQQIKQSNGQGDPRLSQTNNLIFQQQNNQTEGDGDGENLNQQVQQLQKNYASPIKSSLQQQIIQQLNPSLYYYQSSKQKQPQTLWMFLINTQIAQQHNKSLKQLYLLPQNYKQYNLIYPNFKYLVQIKKFIKKVQNYNRHLSYKIVTSSNNKAKSSTPTPTSITFKYKIVTDSYNANDMVEEFKNNANVAEIYIWNDRKQQGLDQILPLKKKTNKIISVHNSILSLIIKAQKEIDYRFALKQIKSYDDPQQSMVQPIYPNAFPNFNFIPYTIFPPRINTFLQLIATSIGLPIAEKKNRLEVLLQHLKQQFRQNSQYLEYLDQLENINHVSPIVNEDKALEVFKVYFGLKSNIEEDKERDEKPQWLFDFIRSKITARESIEKLELGVNEIFHSIKQLAKYQHTSKQKQSAQNNNNKKSEKSQRLQQSSQNFFKSSQLLSSIQPLSVGNYNNSLTLPIRSQQFYYKIFTFPIQRLNEMVGKFIQMQEFLEVYKDVSLAEKDFNLNHHKIVSSQRNYDENSLNYTEWIRNKVLLKLQVQWDNSSIKNKVPGKQLIVDYGIVDFNKIYQKLRLQISQRWENIAIVNIMSVFKITKLQQIKLPSTKSFIPVLCLKYPSLKQIFQQDPNYLSFAHSNIWDFYRKTNIFKAVNGEEYNQINKKNGVYGDAGKKRERRAKEEGGRKTLFNNSPVMNDFFSTPKENLVVSTKKLQIKSRNTKDFYMSSILQINQNSSSIQVLPVKPINIKALVNHLATLRDSYQQIGAKHQNVKKKIAKIDSQNQKNNSLLLQYYQLQEELYQIKLQLEDYHTCGLHVQNMGLILKKYPQISDEEKQRTLSVRKAKVNWLKGYVHLARKDVQETIQGLYQIIEKQKYESQSCCNSSYCFWFCCSCSKKTPQQLEYYEDLLQRIQSIFLPSSQRSSQQSSSFSYKPSTYALANSIESRLQQLLNQLNDIIISTISLHTSIQTFFSLYPNHSHLHSKISTIQKSIYSHLLHNNQYQQKLQTTTHNYILKSRYYRLLGYLSPGLQQKIIHYSKSIQTLQEKQPYNYISAVYYEQMGDYIRQGLMSIHRGSSYLLGNGENSINNSSSNSSSNPHITTTTTTINQSYIFNSLLKCLEYYQMSISYFQCHINCQIHIVKCITSIVELLVVYKQYRLVSQYVVGKLGQIEEWGRGKENISSSGNNIKNQTNNSNSDQSRRSTLSCRTQLSHLFYLISILHEKTGEISLSFIYIKKSLLQLQCSIQKQKISTYQVLNQLSPKYFEYKLHYLKISILMYGYNKFYNNNNFHFNQAILLEQYEWLKKIYKQHYIAQVNGSNMTPSTTQQENTQHMAKLYQINSLYEKYIKNNFKKYYKYMLKSVLCTQRHLKDQYLQNQMNTLNEQQITDIIQGNIINFERYCSIAMQFMNKGKDIAQILLRRVQIMYQKAMNQVKKNNNKRKGNKSDVNTPNNRHNTSIINLNQSSQQIQPNFSTDQTNKILIPNDAASINVNNKVENVINNNINNNINIKNTTTTTNNTNNKVSLQNWQCLYWRYYLVKGTYLRHNQQFNQSIRYLRKGIQMGKLSHYLSWKVDLTIFRKSKNAENKSSKTQQHRNSLLINNNNPTNNASIYSINLMSQQKITSTYIIYQVLVYQTQLNYILLIFELLEKFNQRNLKNSKNNNNDKEKQQMKQKQRQNQRQKQKFIFYRSDIEHCQKLIQQIFKAIIIRQMIKDKESQPSQQNQPNQPSQQSKRRQSQNNEIENTNLSSSKDNKTFGQGKRLYDIGERILKAMRQNKWYDDMEKQAKSNRPIPIANNNNNETEVVRKFKSLIEQTSSPTKNSIRKGSKLNQIFNSLIGNIPLQMLSNSSPPQDPNLMNPSFHHYLPAENINNLQEIQNLNNSLSVYANTTVGSRFGDGHNSLSRKLSRGMETYQLEVEDMM